MCPRSRAPDADASNAAVEELITLKRTGLPIANSFQQLEAMIPYFKNPDAMRVAVQSHAGHEGKASCTAMVGLQLQPNGDVIVCYGKPPVGNVVDRSIRDIVRCWTTAGATSSMPREQQAPAA